MKAILVAAIAAIAIEPIAFLLLFVLPQVLTGSEIPLGQALGVSVVAGLLAIPFVVLIGIPALLLLRRWGRASWRSLGAIGFFSAALLPAMLELVPTPGLSSSGIWHGRYVDFVIDGQPTLYGWLSLPEDVLFFGLHGLAGALTFYFVWHHSLGPGNSFDRKLLRGSGRFILILMVAVLVDWASTSRIFEPAREEQSTRSDCFVGPLHKTYGQARWLVYACDDSRSVVILSDEAKPALGPAYFITYDKHEGYVHSYTKGAGKRADTQAAFDEMKALTQTDVAELVEEAQAVQGSGTSK